MLSGYKIERVARKGVERNKVGGAGVVICPTYNTYLWEIKDT